MNHITESDRVSKIAILVALACVLQISESMIPHPVPGLRLGLANMVTLIALVHSGFRTALEIAVFRTLLSSLIMGTFMSPTFILSFSGAVVSTVVMGIFFRLSAYYVRFGVSIIGISIIGALSHNMVQLYLAYLILVKHSGIFAFFPWLCLGAGGSGWVTGIVAARVCRVLKEDRVERDVSGTVYDDSPAPQPALYLPGESFIHRLPSRIKITAVFILSLPLLICDDFRLSVMLFLFLAVVAVLSGTSLIFLFKRMKSYLFLVLTAFLLPLFFNTGSHVLFDAGYVSITLEGVATGSFFAVRILFMIVLSSLLVRTTAPDELSRGLARMLSPVGYLGISEQRVAKVFHLSWAAIPVIRDSVRSTIRSANLSRAKNLRNLIPLLSQLIAQLYMETEPGGRLRRHLSPEVDKSLPEEDITESRSFNE